YVTGSSSGVTTSDPTQVFDADLQRWKLTWGESGEELPLFTILSGETKTQVLKAKGTLESGGNYLNEVNLGYEPVVNLNEATAFADVVLVLDNSGSINASELVDLKNASNAIVDAFKLWDTDGRIRIGVTRFRGTSESVVGMTDVDEHNSDGFVYVDDAFRGTNEPDYASGVKTTSEGFTNGGLKVLLVGTEEEETTIYGISGGFEKDFTLSSSTELQVSFRYNLSPSWEYQNNEYSEVLIAIDSQLIGAGGNDYVDRIYGGSPSTTGWQLFETTIPALASGSHTLTIGGYNNETWCDEDDCGHSTEILIDDIVLTPITSTVPTPYLDLDFDADDEGSVYLDDTFRSTSEPAYADGQWLASGGSSGGGLQVSLGGIDGAVILGMSGGWRKDFSLSSSEEISLSFDYNLNQDSS
ncbi:MAG: hypothetical protein V3T78_11545, partial [Dehalococcoidia bacterium]